MTSTAAVYRQLLHPIEPVEAPSRSHFVSTVTGGLFNDTHALQTLDYWIQNLVEPVQFSNGVTEICISGAKQAAEVFVEIGPHSALRSPIRDILKAHGRNIDSDYMSILVRHRAADLTALQCVGQLVATGCSVNLTQINGLTGKLVTTLPPYPFNDKTKYWLEGRTSSQYRFRKYVPHEFLGTRVDDWNECEPRWTNRIILEQSPWLKDHRVNGLVIFPAAGFLVMAIEAVRQVYGDREVALGYKMRDVNFPKAVTLTEENRGTELQLTLRTAQSRVGSSRSENAWDQFVIFVFENDTWVECCSGAIAVEYQQEDHDLAVLSERKQSLSASVHLIETAIEYCTTHIESSDIYSAFERAGLAYGPAFKAIKNAQWDRKGQAVGFVDVHLSKTFESGVIDPHLIHPTALDAILQVTFPAYSIYAKNASATTVPTGLRTAWFSADVADVALGSKALVHAQVTAQGFRKKVFSIAAALEGSETPMFIGEMETSTIGSSDSNLTGEDKPLYKIEYKPDFDLLPNRTLFLEPDATKDPNLMHDKKLLCLASMQLALNQITGIPSHLPVHLQEYVQWMRIKAGEHPSESSESVESLCQRLEFADVEARLLVRVARNLPSILAGETDPLNLLFSDDILSDFYSNFHSNQQLLSCAAKQVEILAHKNPAMRVLEIGAGTGSATEHILGALGDRILEYVYTDVTPSFFLKARERFTSSKLIFKTLDISRDPIPQGYKEGDVDLIIAANVLHAANGIQNSLVQCRKLLRPNGRILLLEMTNREHLLEPYIFGLLPGLSREASPESEENHSPLLTESEWDDRLRKTGFSGVDTCINDAGYITEESVSAIMISRAVTLPQLMTSSIKVIFDTSSATQSDLFRCLEECPMASKDGLCIVPVPWNAAIEQEELIQSTCIFLADSSGDLLGRLREDDLKKLKYLLTNVKAVIWVTLDKSDKEENPVGGLIPGLSRTLATENENCRLISVALDAQSLASDSAGHILQILDALMQTAGVPEDEYAEKEGALCIPRVIRDSDMSSHIFTLEHTETKAWSELKNSKLTLSTVGRLNTLHFEQSDGATATLGPDDLIVEVKAVGLSLRDLLVAQGQIYDESFGSECAGVVVQTGSSPTHDFRIGDRVFGIARGAVAKEVRCKSYQLQKVLPEFSLCEAAIMPVALCTAYYSLVHCARLKKGDSVLIHRGAPGIEQSAIQLAQLYECEVFVTVDSPEQATHLHETYDIPSSHILSDRTFDLSAIIKRLTNGRGVDVVVSGLRGEAARESWECLASFGRFIDIGDSAPISGLSMGRSRMFVSVEINELARNAEFADVFDHVTRLVTEKKLLPPKLAHVFKQSETEAAFRMLQTEEYQGRVAVEMVSDEIIQLVLASSTKQLFDPNSSYLLAGGFGGIGQSIARWMLQNGARNLILPSRVVLEGTASPREAFIKELRAQGATIKVPLCDIADKDQLSQVLRELGDMPPIKGCIQAAMIVRDSSFANMSIEDWQVSLAPKLAGSWNLHQLLPENLDFFIMFSSSTGIMGSFGQSNYTAGNTYQDALATHRMRHGQRAHSIAMSMVTGVGWVAENAQVQALLRVRGMLEEVSLNDIYELLRYCCDPEHADVGAQIITPLSLPADLRALGIVEPLGSTRPIYSFLHTLPSRYAESGGATSGQESKKLPSFSLPDATTLAEATDIITEAIQIQLSSLLVVSKDDIDPEKPIHRYGVDSLVAVEMRNWFAKGVGADVGTIEILGEAAIKELAGRVAKKSKYVKEDLKS